MLIKIRGDVSLVISSFKSHDGDKDTSIEMTFVKF